MTSRWRLDSGVLPPSHRWRAALAFLAALLLAGCSARPIRSTSPSSQTGASITDTTSADLIEPGLDLVPPSALGGPIAGLDAAGLARFNAGKDDFEEIESLDEGLGPVFNEASCATCHAGPTGGTNGRVETRFGRMIGGTFDPLAGLGGSLLQDHAVGPVGAGANAFTYVPENVPAEANVRAGRVTTPLFGLGLVDAVPDFELLQIAQREAFQSPFSRGVPNFVTEIRTGATRVGRFGWKAQVPTLHQFSGDAYLNEMGITSPEFPTENSPQGNAAVLLFNPAPGLNDDGTQVGQVNDFMSFLAPPPRKPHTFQTYIGGSVFRAIGCADCHTPTLVTGPNSVAALSHKAFQPYSDFLLHDMGSLGDGIVQGRAGPRQMRTAPLWGLLSRSSYLHDGRAKTPEAAILAHAGQGSLSRFYWTRLGPGERAAMLAFLRSL